MVDGRPGSYDKPAVAIVYDLASGQELARRSVDIDGLGGAAGTQVIGISGDRVLLRQLKHMIRQPAAAVWNWRTGSLTASTAEVLDLSAGGDVLSYVVRPDPVPTRTGPDGTPLPPYGPGSPLPPFCMTVAPLADVLPADQTGFCSSDYALRLGGTVAPDGAWVAMMVAAGDTTRTELERTSDLRAGAWRPVHADLPGTASVQFWDTDATFIAWGVDSPSSTERSYWRCQLSGQCGSVTLPDGGVLVPPASR
jgi:hypothetical protein